MATVTVDVDIDEFELKEILEEIEHRYNKNGIRGKSNELAIDDFIKRMKIDFEDVMPLQSMSLSDKLKFEFLTKNFDKITLNDLEKIIT